MTCKQCQQQLDAFADNALPPVQSWRARRHWKHCPACAQVHAEIVQLGSEARAWRDVAPPTALQSRILAALPPPADRRERAAALGHHRPRKMRFALALAVCLVAILTVALWPGKQPALPATYADTVAAMERVRSASWTETDTVTNPQGRVTQRRVEQTWVQRDPPAIAILVPPDPTVPGSGYRSLATSQGFWQAGHDSNHININADATRLEHIAAKVLEQMSAAAKVRVAMLPLTPTDFRKRGSLPQWKQEQVQLNGQTVTRFRQDLGTGLWPTKAHQVLRGPVTFLGTIWVDPLSHHVQRRALQIFGPLMGHVDFITDHFVYDHPAPAGVFDEAAYPPQASVRPLLPPHAKSDDGTRKKGQDIRPAPMQKKASAQV